jgi:hypothetical protein
MFGICCWFFGCIDLLLCNEVVSKHKNRVAIANTYTSLDLYILWYHFCPIKLFCRSRIPWPNMAVLRGLYRPQYFCVRGSLGPIVIDGVTSRGPDPVIQYEDKAQLDFQ